jgi:hypothetical protein
MEHLDAIKSLLLTKVERFCSTQGITLKYDDLVKHINITSQEVLDYQIKSKPKPDPKSKPKKLFIKPKKSNKKLILKPKKINNDYITFTNICDKNQFQYFQFHDEHNWIGPAINIKIDDLSKVMSYFNPLKTTKISGTNFYIIRPSSNLKDDNIKYHSLIDDCKIESESLMGITSDDDIYDQTTDDELVELDVWTYEATNTKYQIDPKTNILYSFQTNEPVGKKIDEFTIDFNYN